MARKRTQPTSTGTPPTDAAAAAPGAPPPLRMSAHPTPSATRSRATVSGRTAPSHIVVFRERSEKNVHVLEKLIPSLGKQRAARTSGVMSFGGESAARPAGKVYPQLAAAAVSIPPDRIEEFLRAERVEFVIPNEIRYPQVLRRGPRTSGSTGGAGTAGGRGGPTDPFRASGGGATDYILGWRDALNALVQGMGLGRSQQAGVAGAAAAGHRDGLTYGLTMICISRSRQRYSGRGVKVAVLDTGIDRTHPDFVNRFVNPDRLQSFMDGVEVDDDDGHGTHCAGVIGGAAESVGGVRYGVAPECDLYVGKVLGPDGGYDSDILEGIEWALMNGCRIISMSLGSPRDENEPFSVAYESIARRMLDRPDGALIIAAAGNESRRQWGQIAPVANPAACPSIMAVAAIDADEQVAWFSCGQKDDIGLVNIAGPGVDVYSSYLGGRFEYLGGTSMATPHVAGAAALWLEAEPSLTPSQLWSRLSAAARTLPAPAADVGRGLVQTPGCAVAGSRK